MGVAHDLLGDGLIGAELLLHLQQKAQKQLLKP